MKVIEKIFMLSTMPKESGVLWLDTSSNPAAWKAFLNGDWMLIGSAGGGMSEEGTPGNLPVIGLDGKSLVDGLISEEELSNIITLIGTWDAETVLMVRNASTLSYFLNVLVGVNEIPTFSASAYYAIGDVCLKDGNLYRFTSAHHGSWVELDALQTNFYREFVRYYSGAVDVENVAVLLNFDTTMPSLEGKYITTIVGGVSTLHLISNTGLCLFTMAKLTLYTIEFPTFLDFHNIANRSFTAYIAQRSVEANYTSSQGEATDETVTLKTSYTTGTGYPAGVVSVTDNTTSVTTTYNLSATGECLFIIPLGHTYTVTLPQISGYITTVTKTFTASLPIRTITSKYAPLVSGMFIMDAELTLYTYELWVAAGKSGTEAKYIYCSDSTLATHGGAFFFNIDDIRTTATIPSKLWLSSSVLVDTLQTFGSRALAINDFGVVPYDPSTPGSGPISNMNAIKSWIDNLASLGMTYTSAMYNYAITKDLTIDGSVHKAYIGTAGLWRYLSNESDGNYSALNALMNYLHGTDATIPADLGWTSKSFWTTTQGSSTDSWCLYVGSLTNGVKGVSGLCLCFYAL